MRSENAVVRGLRWLRYRAVSSVVHQPLLLRRLATLGQRQPWLARAAGAVVSRDDVVATFNRQAQFSSVAHQGNLVAGEFLIGLESGPAHAAQRWALMARLPAPDVFGMLAATESRSRSLALLAEASGRFDLVSNYMEPIVWRALRSSFGEALPTLADHDPVFDYVRHIAAHLLVGAVATDAVQTRARESAAALDIWLRERLPAVQAAWGDSDAAHQEQVMRDAIGLLWVGHLPTVHAFSLIVLDLLPRRQWQTLSALVRRSQAAKVDPWENAELRKQIADHILESMRFRPPFPLLKRLAMRETHVGARNGSPVAGGTMLTLAAIGAMFDPAAHEAGQSAHAYCPARRWVNEKDRYLMFGHGARQCIARDHVVQVLVSALIGLLLLPRPCFVDPWWRRFRLDGPAIVQLRLKFKAG
jgi:cytochrome P450